MSINVISPHGFSRQPRGAVKINEELIDGWVQWSVTNNNYYDADTFSLVFALSALSPTRNAKWFSEQTEIFCEIFDGVPPDAENFTEKDLTSKIYGRVDDVELDPVARTIHVSGRDLTAKFIDARTTEKYQNKTSSEIAVMLAQKRGLAPVVTATKTKTGLYYQIDHARLTDVGSEWDLLTKLAQQEGFVVFVKGKELHFEPRPAQTIDPYLLKWEDPTDENASPTFNGMSLQMRRNLTVARGVVVTVDTWHQKNGKHFSESYPKAAKTIKAGKSSNDAQLYNFTFPNLTPEAALAKAQSLYQDIVRHEMNIEVTMPCDELLQTTSILQLDGTGTAFDQIYYPNSITRTMGFGEYSMSFSAKNHNPESQVGI